MRGNGIVDTWGQPLDGAHPTPLRLNHKLPASYTGYQTAVFARANPLHFSTHPALLLRYAT